MATAATFKNPGTERAVGPAWATLEDRFHAVRSRSLELCRPLSAEDMMVQSCAEASPAKWHIAHTAWFFESFLLTDFLPGYRLFNESFPWLFNSYYQTYGEFPDKRLRSSFSRPALQEILSYRAHVDEAVIRLLKSSPPDEALRRIELGLHHEQQHQELLLTDIKHALFTNPLQPAYRETVLTLAGAQAPPLDYLDFEGGLIEIGLSPEDGLNFAFDNERPRHKVWLEPWRLASRLVTCGEYAEFIADGGYTRGDLWLSAGWDAVKANGWKAPMYWASSASLSANPAAPGHHRSGRHASLDGWSIGTLRGHRTLAEIAASPVAHISYFEADAYARWAGKRLATEAEWEAAASTVAVSGNLLDSDTLETMPAAGQGLQQVYGDCWEWTASAYLGYPGFQPLNGALGEYNGKFMSGQMVLRGGSCVTPASHIRSTYRNFFPPETRWQFSGIRLASSIETMI